MFFINFLFSLEIVFNFTISFFVILIFIHKNWILMLPKKTEQKIFHQTNQSFDAYRNFMSDFFEIFNIVKPDLHLLQDQGTK